MGIEPEPLTTATASSRPKDPQLTIRANTPSKHTLEETDRQMADVETLLSS